MDCYLGRFFEGIDKFKERVGAKHRFLAKHLSDYIQLLFHINIVKQ